MNMMSNDEDEEHRFFVGLVFITGKQFPTEWAGDEMMCKCLRCGYEWDQRTPEKPRQCPRCKNPRWDTEPKFRVPQPSPKKITPGREPERAVA